MEDITERVGRRPRTMLTVLEGLQAHAHEELKIENLAEEIGLSFMQTRDAIYRLARKENVRIDNVVRGHVIRYVPSTPAPPSKVKAEVSKAPTVAQPPRTRHGRQTFEEIGQTRDGRYILQSGEGNLYEAKEL